MVIRTGLSMYVLGINLLALMTFPLSASAATDAYIKLQIDSSEVFSGDIVVLDVEATGLLDPIDFSVLEQHATLLRETTGTRIAVIKGKVQEIAIRRMDLQPTRTGVIVFGPLVSGEVISNSVHINVLDATRPEWTPATDDAKIVTTLTPEQPVVNQQALLTIDLLHRYPVNSESFQLPQLSGFAKRTLIENRRTYIGEDKEWHRTRWQTLIYPRQSGQVTIDGIEWSGTMAKSNAERATFTRTSPPLQLSVDSAPADATGWWLPSQSVTLSQSWSSTLMDVRAGDEFERTIKVTAVDVLAGQIPVPYFPPSRGLKQVLINTTREENLQGDRMISTADFTWRVTAQSPIAIFLDTVRLKWWDTNEKTQREAIIPPRKIYVALPERADVLTKLALQENPGDRLNHYLESTDPVRLMSYLAAGIALLCLSIWFVPALWRHITHRLRLNNHIKMLEKLAQRGESHLLYKTLQMEQSKALLRGTQRNLITQLEQQLYCKGAGDKTPALPLTEWLKPVASAAKNLRPQIDNSQPQVLAEL